MLNFELNHLTNKIACRPVFAGGVPQEKETIVVAWGQPHEDHRVQLLSCARQTTVYIAPINLT
jgi:hypothetical protein